jgi:lipopolysaccharide/colanic/teichoic acid biosynthesis glycosyltransferase
MYKDRIKRLLDIVLSTGGLVILSPLFALIMVYIYLKTGEVPFFVQKRPGLQGRIFTVIKFRTMSSVCDKEGNLLPDTERINSWGEFLRETSLDEIPQLINVLKGDMSLIGPRPLLPGYLPLYSNFHLRRHEVRPGITGWAQINGRNAISWQQKFDLDVWYIDNLSFKLDCKIFFLTIKKVLIKESINYSKTITMPEFDGSN